MYNCVVDKDMKSLGNKILLSNSWRRLHNFDHGRDSVVVLVHYKHGDDLERVIFNFNSQDLWEPFLIRQCSEPFQPGVRRLENLANNRTSSRT